MERKLTELLMDRLDDLIREKERLKRECERMKKEQAEMNREKVRLPESGIYFFAWK
jgi:hypothetical protein